MKKFNLIFMILLCISFTSCSSTAKYDINEFIKRYNSVSETSISTNNILTTDFENQIIYRIFADKSTILTLKANKLCEVSECSISTPNQNNDNKFESICAYTLMVITGCDKPRADKTISNSKNKTITINEYEVLTIKDSLQTTIIIKLLTENTNNNPTLKNFLK